MKNILLFITLVSITNTSIANDLYRAPSPGDSGTYFILNSEKNDEGVHTLLTSRVGKDNAYTDFTKLKVNCNSQQYMELAGGSEDGVKKKPSKLLKDWSKSKWTPIVAGSSKFDLVRHVCNKK